MVASEDGFWNTDFSFHLLQREAQDFCALACDHFSPQWDHMPPRCSSKGLGYTTRFVTYEMFLKCWVRLQARRLSSKSDPPFVLLRLRLQRQTIVAFKGSISLQDNSK
jgi:hypothetical protein